MRKVCVLGGTGFVGTRLVSRLATLGWQIKVLTRQREQRRDLLVLPTINLVSANPFDPSQLNAQLAGFDVVINLVGILNEVGQDGSGFQRAHVDLPQNIINACKANGIKRLLQMSALHADAKTGTSHYLRTKGEAEDLVHAAEGINVTSFRPSVIFGEDDSFFNRFAQFLRLPFYFFLVPCPNAKMAPVWINDVVEAMVRTIDNPQHYGQRYNLCGPEIYTHRKLWEYTARMLEVNRRAIPLSDANSKRLARVGDKIPFKPFSTDNYQSLQTDSVCTTNHLPLLGIQPTSIAAVMPKHFATTSKHHYDRLRSAAHRS